MNRRTRARVAALASMAVPVLLIQAAWACIPQPLVSIRPKASGPAGSEVTVDALAVAGEAEVRWNSVDGPRLATASGPTFSVPVKIPDVEDGLYSIVVLERQSTGSLASTGRIGFLVTSGDGAAGTGDPAATGEAAQREDDSSGLTPTVALAGGAVLVGLGAIAGSAWSRKRRRQPAAT